MRRFTRLTNGLFKKVEAHANAVALHFMYYNFVRHPCFARMTPAMAAGVTGLGNQRYRCADRGPRKPKAASGSGPVRKASQLIDPRPITNETILMVLGIVLVEIARPMIYPRHVCSRTHFTTRGHDRVWRRSAGYVGKCT